MKIAVIGLGDIARKAYLPLLATRSDIELTLCTRNSSILHAVANQYRIAETTCDLQNILHGSNKPLAAFVHSATESHPEIVTKLLEQGIHVYVDKPLAYRLADAQRMVDLAQRQNLILMTGFNRRFAPMVAALQNGDGEQTIIMQKNRLHLPDHARRFVFDDFIHVVDTLRFLSGSQNSSVRVSSMQKDGLLHQVILQLEGSEGIAIGMMHRDSGTTEEVLEVIRPGNKWRVDGLSHTIHYHNGREQHTAFNDWDSILFRRGFCQIVDHFIECVAHHTTPRFSARDALETHALCEQIVSEIGG